VTRREMLRLTGATVAAAAAAPPVFGQKAPQMTSHTASTTTAAAAAQTAKTAAVRHMGATPAGFPFRSHVSGFDIVEYTHGLGLGAVQTRTPDATPEAVRAFRQKLEGYGMRAILDVRMPRAAGDLPDFEKTIKTASECGAVCMHAAMTGRRYEDFDTLSAFQASFAQNKQSVTMAEPILRKYKMKLAIENHKGWRAGEQAAWLKAVGSEYVGVTFDFGNNLSLCEDPAESLRLLLPYTFYCHMKDMAVAPYDEGFLLSEVALGEGFLDIPGMVSQLQAKDPEMIMGLEMITRDPLKIPVFTDKYWVSFSDPSSTLSGSDLAHTLMLVKKHPPKQPLPQTTGLTPAAQLTLEDGCIARSIEFARGHLHL
jgi:sugar phosphate isomerase/epimerase